MSKVTIHEAANLAAHVLECEPMADLPAIEKATDMAWGIDVETFSDILTCIMPNVLVAGNPITDTQYIGFFKPGRFGHEPLVVKNWPESESEEGGASL